MQKVLSRLIALLFILLWSHTGMAQQQDSILLLDYTLDDLMNLRVESAAKRSETIADVPASIVVISRQDIENYGWQTLEEVLSNVPGMYHINDYLWFGADNFGIRGFFSSGSFSTMVVMVNGVSQREDWYNSFPLSKINVAVEAIDRIEVIRGPMSVVYGSNAFLGAINIITNQTDDESLAAIAAGSNGNYRAYGRVSGGSDKLKFSINLAGYGSNGINQPYSKMTDDIHDGWNLPTNPTSSGQLEYHRIYLDAWFSIDNFYFGFLQSHSKRGVIDYYPGFDDGHLANIQATSSVFGYKRSFSKEIEAKAEVGYYSFRNLLDYKHNSDTTAYGFIDIFSDALDAELNINLNPTSKWDVTFGAYYRRVMRDKLVVDAPNLSDDYVNLDAGLARGHTIQTWAAFFQTSYALTDRFSLFAGARVEQTPGYEISYSVRFDPSGTYNYLSRVGEYMYGDPYIIPRAALLYHISSKHHLKFMYGRAIKQASIGENMDIVRYPDREQLKPANMQTLEVNYYSMLSNRSVLNVSLFQNFANNLISRTNQMENGVMRLYNTNSGKLTTLGLETSIQLKPTQNFSSSLSVILQHSNNRQEGYEDIALEYAPSFLAYGTLSYLLVKRVSVGLSGYYVGAMETYWRPDTRDASNANDNRNPIQLIADGSRIGQQAPGYFLLNTNVRFNNIFHENVYCSLYLHNLLNTEVRYPTTRSNDIFEKGTLGHSRYLMLSFGIHF
ncbi:MAG: TonB-dependent receptor [Tenuifilaceae bacterium]|nr:TonB-dependent receptor [Tenuifilaceae bacterium]